MVPGENTQMVPFEETCHVPDETRALCIIRDMTNSQNAKITLNLPMSTTAVQLVEEVGKKCHYHPDTFELVLQRMPDGDSIVINEQGDQSLEELGFRSEGKARNILILGEKNGELPRKVEGYYGRRSVIEDNTPYKGSGDTNNTYVPPAPPPYSLGSFDFSYGSNYGNTVIRQETGFVGLVNQAMTCYLNSLLQTLYMTPEFRNALYRWDFDGFEEEGGKSIPFQLQKLFLQLQTSKKAAVGTTELTTSFGWDSSEAWQQHDVQELCRVMFDALEKKFKNTDQADLISRLYEGKLKDYVKCLQCGNESAREDTFLDVPLVVRPFGSNQAYASVEEALHAFVTPETLEGSNQYFCDKCGKKCDAHKGLKFIKFPYLLTLQLKRFDFDPATMHRIKLNDKVTFPEILNLNGFVKSDSELVSGNGDITDSGSGLDDETFYTGCPKTETFHTSECFSDNGDVVDDDEGIDMGLNGLSNSNQEASTNERNLQKSMAKGPYVYELFSIMVHSGSANGGHYYAYIKSFQDGQWYCFNDAQVTRITYDDIRKTYGGGPNRGYYSSAYSSSTNAYMLMYRQIDKAKNAEPMPSAEFPEHIKTLMKCMEEVEEKERQLRELERSMCKIKLFYYHPLQKRMIEMKLKVHKDNTLAEATETAHKIMGLDGKVPLDCCRLVKYDEFHGSLECSFENADDKPMGELLDGVKSSYKFDLLLESKRPDEEFLVYRPGGTTVRVHVVDLETEEISLPITVRGHLSQTVEEFKQQITQNLGVSSSTVRVVLERYTNDLRPLISPNKTLKSEGFYRSNKVFVEYKDQDDAALPFLHSKFHQILDRYEHTICIHISLPKVDKEILERLCIVPSDYECNGQDCRDDSNSEAESHEEQTESVHKRFFPRSPGVCADCKTLKDNDTSVPLDSTKNSSETFPEFHYGDIKVENRTGLHSSKSNIVPQDSPKNSHLSNTSDDTSQDCDEGLGDSEMCDSTSNGCSTHAVYSDQSEDSSLTDSERTLVGEELSPRNNSPDILSNEIENDPEPPKEILSNSGNVSFSMSETTHLQSSSSSSSSPPNEPLDDDKNLSPGESSKYFEDTNTYDNFQASSSDQGEVAESIQKKDARRYFRAFPYTDLETGEKTLRVYLDKRITLGAVKKELEPWIGISADCFKIYRLYSNNQEFECTRLSESLSSYDEDTRLTVKLGRALRKGEYRVKVYQLVINDPEPCKFLVDWVFAKGMTVLQAKKDILPEVEKKCGTDIPLNCCRLRKKSWKNPGTIFMDGQCFEDDIPISANWEVFVEVLKEPENVTSVSQLALFARRWHPSNYQLDSFQEIILDKDTVEELKTKLSEVSEIPCEFIEFAKGQGTFPCEMSLFVIHTELDWHSQTSSLNMWPLYIGDDGHVIYYRDKREEVKKLSEEEKRVISSKENARLNKLLKGNYSPRREKALKIYTDSTPSDSTCNSAITVDSSKSVISDLD